jgi:hypothetical protein
VRITEVEKANAARAARSATGPGAIASTSASTDEEPAASNDETPGGRTATDLEEAKPAPAKDKGEELASSSAPMDERDSGQDGATEEPTAKVDEPKQVTIDLSAEAVSVTLAADTEGSGSVTSTQGGSAHYV